MYNASQRFAQAVHTLMSLHWNHNGRDGVSNHEHNDGLLNRLFSHGIKKTPNLRFTGLCAGNSPVNSPHKWPVTRKMVPFDDVITVLMWPIMRLSYIGIISECQKYGTNIKRNSNQNQMKQNLEPVLKLWFNSRICAGLYISSQFRPSLWHWHSNYNRAISNYMYFLSDPYPLVLFCHTR